MFYIAHTEEQLPEHLSKHRYGIKNRPDNLAKQVHKSYNINGNRNATILQNNIKTAAA